MGGPVPGNALAVLRDGRQVRFSGSFDTWVEFIASVTHSFRREWAEVVSFACAWGHDRGAVGPGEVRGMVSSSSDRGDS